MQVESIVTLGLSLGGLAVSTGLFLGRVAALQARVRRLERSSEEQGKRIGSSETAVAVLADRLQVRRITRAAGVPDATVDDEGSDGG